VLKNKDVEVIKSGSIPNWIKWTFAKNGFDRILGYNYGDRSVPRGQICPWPGTDLSLICPWHGFVTLKGSFPPNLVPFRRELEAGSTFKGVGNAFFLGFFAFIDFNGNLIFFQSYIKVLVCTTDIIGGLCWLI